MSTMTFLMLAATFLPLLGALGLLAAPKENRRAFEVGAVLITLASFLLSVPFWFQAIGSLQGKMDAVQWAWTTDWISDDGRRKMREYGIAPPGRCGESAPTEAPIRLVRRQVSAAPAVECPRCNSTQTERLSAFGSTACKALYRCISCREPFEHFKPI